MEQRWFFLSFLTFYGLLKPSTSMTACEKIYVEKSERLEEQFVKELLNEKEFLFNMTSCKPRFSVEFHISRLLLVGAKLIFYVGFGMRAPTINSSTQWTLDTEKAPFIMDDNHPMLVIIIRGKDRFSETNRFIIERENFRPIWGKAMAPIDVDLHKTPQSYRAAAYVILCGYLNRRSFLFQACYVAYEKERNMVNCQCETSNFIPAAILIVHLVLSLLVTFIFHMAEGEKKQNENSHSDVLWVMCSPKTVQHQYEICFKIGCPSENFNMVSTVIDFELLAPENRSMCQGRIHAHRLQRDEISEIHFTMNRLTVLAPQNIAAISFRHTDGNADSEIYLYGMDITEPTSGQRYYYPIKKYIKSIPRRKNIFCSTDFKPADKDTKDDTPRLPIPHLNPFDRQVIVYFVSIITSLATFVTIDWQTESVVPFVAILVGTTAEVLVILTLRTYIIANDIKERLVDGKETSVFSMIHKGFLGLISSVSLVALAFISFRGFYFRDENTLRWITSSFLATTVTIGVWVVFETVISFRGIVSGNRREFDTGHLSKSGHTSDGSSKLEKSGLSLGSIDDTLEDIAYFGIRKAKTGLKGFGLGFEKALKTDVKT